MSAYADRKAPRFLGDVADAYISIYLNDGLEFCSALGLLVPEFEVALEYFSRFLSNMVGIWASKEARELIIIDVEGSL